MSAKPRVVLVTDPMCSWCWGMASDFENARLALAEAVDFELMLGGINVHGTQPIGDYGRRFMRRLWEDVAATTGQAFGTLYEQDYVHNSVLPCLAIQAITDLRGTASFDVLHQLQRDFFVAGRNINDRDYLRGVAAEFEVDAAAFERLLNDPDQLAKIKFQFDLAGQFGTQALPSLLVADNPDDANKLTLLAGGYVDANMLQTLIEARLPAG